jgi:hypothetical protein
LIELERRQLCWQRGFLVPNSLLRTTEPLLLLQAPVRVIGSFLKDLIACPDGLVVGDWFDGFYTFIPVTP